MKQILRPMVILGVICIVCAGLLGVVESITREPIAIQEEATANAGMKKVFADAASFEEVEIEPGLTVNDVEIGSAYSAVDASGSVIGYVVEVLPSGFGGTIDTMVGIDLENKVTGISILSLSESPGLGARAKEESFQEQFIGQSAPVKVTKDGGTIQAITSSTITSRAVSKGVTAACNWAEENAGGAN